MMSTNLLIHSIYPAIEGEGARIGTPQIFVRLQGCAIGCINCDSMETWEFSASTERTQQQILGELDECLSKNPVKWISVTGGDPMHPKFKEGVLALVKTLKNRGFFVNIEASGTRVDFSIFEKVDFISFDIKTPSTGVKFPLRPLGEYLKSFPHKGQVKSVISDRNDFDFVTKVFFGLEEGQQNACPWVLTPEYCVGEKFDSSKVQRIHEWVLKEGLPFRVIGQQHKWIHGPDEMLV